MADSPLPTGKLVHQIIYQTLDDDDDGDTPNVIPMRGRGVLTCSVPEMPVITPTGSTTVHLGPLSVVIDDEGYICAEDPHNPGMPLQRGISVTATMGWPEGLGKPVLPVEGALWTMTYTFEPMAGLPQRTFPFRFSVPYDATVDLSTVIKIPIQGAYGVPQAEAAANRAAASAAEAEASASLALVSPQARRLIVLEEGEPLPALNDGDLVVRYPAPGNTYQLDWAADTANTPPSGLVKTAGSDWVAWTAGTDAPGATNPTVLRMNGTMSMYGVPVIDSDPYSDRLDVLMRYRHSAATQHGPQLYFWGDDAEGVLVAFFGSSGSTGTVIVRRATGGGFVDLTNTTIPLVAAADWSMIRASRQGDVIAFKVWPDGTPEPADWQIETVVSTPLPPSFLIGRTSNQSWQYIDWLSVGTGAKTAVAP